MAVTVGLVGNVQSTFHEGSNSTAILGQIEAVAGEHLTWRNFGSSRAVPGSKWTGLPQCWSVQLSRNKMDLTHVPSASAGSHQAE